MTQVSEILGEIREIGRIVQEIANFLTRKAPDRTDAWLRCIVCGAPGDVVIDAVVWCAAHAPKNPEGRITAA